MAKAKNYKVFKGLINRYYISYNKLVQLVQKSRKTPILMANWTNQN